jgi:hypothetical protein
MHRMTKTNKKDDECVVFKRERRNEKKKSYIVKDQAFEMLKI